MVKISLQTFTVQHREPTSSLEVAMFLDAGMPFEVDFEGQSRAILDAKGRPHLVRSILTGGSYPSPFSTTLRVDQPAGFVRRGKTTANNTWVPSDAYGLAIAKPIRIDTGKGFGSIADDPEAVMWFVEGDVIADDEVSETHIEMLVANAARKMRLLSRKFIPGFGPLSTMDIMATQPGWVRDPVESIDSDGTLRWGDFPYPGAVIVMVGPWLIMGALSGFTGPQDHAQITKPLVRFGEWLVDNDVQEIIEGDITKR